MFRVWHNVKRSGYPKKPGVYVVCCNDLDFREGIWCSDNEVVTAWYTSFSDGDGVWTWYDNGYEYEITQFVTHWMKWPNPPIGRYINT